MFCILLVEPDEFGIKVAHIQNKFMGKLVIFREICKIEPAIINKGNLSFVIKNRQTVRPANYRSGRINDAEVFPEHGTGVIIFAVKKFDFFYSLRAKYI